MRDEFRLMDDRGRAFTADEENDYDVWEERERKKRESSLPPPPANQNASRPPATPAPSPLMGVTVSAPAPEPSPVPPPPRVPTDLPPPPPPEPKKRDFNAWYEEREVMLAAALERRDELKEELRLLEERLFFLGVRVGTQEEVAPVEGLEARVVPPPEPRSVRPPFKRVSVEPVVKPKAAAASAPAAKGKAQPAPKAKPSEPSTAAKSAKGSYSNSYVKITAALSDKAQDTHAIAKKVGLNYHTTWRTLQRALERGHAVVEQRGTSRFFKKA